VEPLTAPDFAAIMLAFEKNGMVASVAAYAHQQFLSSCWWSKRLWGDHRPAQGQRGRADAAHENADQTEQFRILTITAANTCLLTL